MDKLLILFKILGFSYKSDDYNIYNQITTYVQYELATSDKMYLFDMPKSYDTDSIRVVIEEGGIDCLYHTDTYLSVKECITILEKDFQKELRQYKISKLIDNEKTTDSI